MQAAQRHNEADKTFARRIRFRRLQLRKSQGELGNAAGITFQQIQKYENGTNRVSAGRLQKIADALEVPVSFFFEPFPGVAKENKLVMDFLKSAYGIRLLVAFSKIGNKRMQLSLLELVEGIAAGSRN